MTAERWQRILRMLKEAFSDYETGLVSLRKRVVGDVKRKLRDGQVLDQPHLEQPPPERPASAARPRRARSRRPRG